MAITGKNDCREMIFLVRRPGWLFVTTPLYHHMLCPPHTDLQHIGHGKLKLLSRPPHLARRRLPTRLVDQNLARLLIFIPCAVDNLLL